MKQNLQTNIIVMTVIIILLQACIDSKEKGSETIRTTWTNYEDPRRSDFTIYLEIGEHDSFKTYNYFESATKDSTPIFTFELHFHPDTFLIDKRDTMPLTRIFQTQLQNDSVKLYRFDYVNFTIHGDGCYIFSEQQGMLGTGRFSGTKLLLREWGSEKVDFNKILEKQKRHHNNK